MLLVLAILISAVTFFVAKHHRHYIA